MKDFDIEEKKNEEVVSVYLNGYYGILSRGVSDNVRGEEVTLDEIAALLSKTVSEFFEYPVTFSYKVN